MAFYNIAFDNHSRVIGSSGSSASVSHTCAGSNRVLYAYVKVYNSGSAINAVTGVTYNSVAMTLIDSQTDGGPGTSYLYGLLNPSTGANNIVATCSGSNSEIDIVGISYTGVRQTELYLQKNKANTTSPNTLSVTTTVDNSWLAGGFGSDSGSTISAGTGTTRRSAAGLVVGMDSNGPKTPTGSYSLQATASGGNIAGIIVSFAPAPINSQSLFYSQI